MCGICGSITPEIWADKSHAESITKRMSDSISHRGPDGSGSFVDWPLGVTLGHRRLAIIDQANGDQPMIHRESGVVLVFNGEIYNYKELRSTLELAGYEFISNSDTEVLLISYIHWGETCFEKFLGMFSCAIWDPVNRKLVCARDRLGIKPFYFYFDSNNFIFGSEIKSLSCHPAFIKDINGGGVYDYSRYGYVPGDHTIYKNTFKLSPGSILTVKLAADKTIRLDKNKFWSLGAQIEGGTSSYTDSDIGDGSDANRSRLRGVLADAVSSHLVSDVKVGALLSGGIDSTLVVDFMAEYDPNVLAHNVQFGQKEFDESIHAGQVASLLGIHYTQDNIPADMCEDIEKIICHFDEPFADASAIAMYYLSKSASNQYKVCLSGDGGDELFAGYNWYGELLKFKTADQFIPLWCRSLLSNTGRSTLDYSLRGSLLVSNLDKDFPDRHEALVSIFQSSWAKKLLSDDALAMLGDFGKDVGADRISQLHRESPIGHDPISSAQYADLNSYLIDDVLVKVDRMSMAHGLEVRVPLLDHRVVESAFSMPSRLKIDRKRRKKPLKRLLKDKYGSLLVDRPKQGFSVPLDKWLTSELFELVDHYLLVKGKTTRSGFFKASEVSNLWYQFTNGKGRIDLSNNLWLLICFEIWHKNSRL